MSSMRMVSTVTLVMMKKKLQEDKVSRIEDRNERKNLRLYKNDGVKIRAKCDGKVHVFTMSQGTEPTDPNHRMEVGPSRSSGPTTRSKKQKNAGTNDDSQASSSILDAHDKKGSLPLGHIFEQVRVNPDIPVKAVQDKLQRELEVHISSTHLNITVKIAFERNIDPSLPTRVFQRIYIYLEALKLGLRACRRDVLGLDGAFMKYLGDDIDMHPNSNLTFIGDRQKGIIPAIRTVYPSRAKSYLLLNNICEAFNGKIVKVGQDGLGGSGAGAVIGLSAGGEGGAGGPGVASQDGREMGDGVPTQSSAAGGASEWYFL
nr:hypothetical protein [Tanacetum cinerariifolium]